MKRVTTTVSPDLLVRVREHAAKQGVSVAEWVRMSLRLHIEVATPGKWKCIERR